MKNDLNSLLVEGAICARGRPELNAENGAIDTTVETAILSRRWSRGADRYVCEDSRFIIIASGKVADTVMAFSEGRRIRVVGRLHERRQESGALVIVAEHVELAPGQRKEEE